MNTDVSDTDGRNRPREMEQTQIVNDID